MTREKQEEMERSLLAQPVRSLQYMLRRLAEDHSFLPKLAVDGVFGEKTLEAVMLFQREFHLPVTGRVDRKTWEAIRRDWLSLEKRLADPRDLRAFPGERSRVEAGDSRDYLVLPQTMFQVLSAYLDGIVPHRADGVHGPASQDNVRWLQRAAGQKDTGVMDAPAWGALSRLSEMFVVHEPPAPGKKRPFPQGWG